jgi:hypothetical protein
MCYGFGVVVTKDLKCWFVEPDIRGNVSHEIIIDRLICSRDIPPFIDLEPRPRRFVRIEFPDWTEESYRVDEIGTIPTWFEEDADVIKEKCTKLMLRARVHYIRMVNVRQRAYNVWFKHYCYRGDEEANEKWNQMHDIRVAAYETMVKKVKPMRGYAPKP